MIITKLETDFHEKDFILLGDFNDNPDDRSLNILETGNPNAPAEAEENPGPFLLNLTETLCAQGHVSHGRTSQDIVNGLINTIDPESRQRNNQARGTNANTGDILFDQLLIPMHMESRFIQGSCRVFNNGVALEGNASNRASDHLRVFAEFVYGGPDESSASGTGQLAITGLLPDPIGEDAGNEVVVISNSGNATVNLAGWLLKDRGDNQYLLSGFVPAHGTLEIKMLTFGMPLNNSGDEVSLIDDNGNLVHHVEYTGQSVEPGAMITF